MKIRWKQQKLWLLVAIMLILTVFPGCGETKVKNSPIQEETLETMEKPLRIFYDGTGYYLLKSFVDAHPEMNIMLINCIPNVDGAIDFDSIVAQYGVPDLIVAREEVSIYLSEWYEEGHIADLSEFCSSDISINPDDYFPETFDVFSENGNMYALPLGISMDVMLIAESKYNNSEFARLEKGYTGRELMNVLLEEIQKEKDAGEFFSTETIRPSVLMNYLDAVTQTDEGVQMDEEVFSQVYEYYCRSKKDAEKAQDFWKGKDFSVNSGYLSRNTFDPRRYEGKFTASIWNVGDAAAVVLSYAETSYQYFLEEGVKAIYFPTADDGSKYQARVKLWGAVAGESSRKELAYELLRQLLDEDIDYFGAPWGIGKIPDRASVLNINVYPINRENAVSFLDRYENQSAELIYKGGQNTLKLDRTDIIEEEKDKHTKMLNSVSGLFCWNEDLQKIDGISDDYYDLNVANYENCYLEMLKALNDKENSVNYRDVEEIESSKEESSDEILDENDVTEETKDVKALKATIRDAEVGDTFFFGKTEQDNNLNNGAEPIEWIVLEKTANEAFVISRKVLEWLTFSQYDDTVKEYNEKGIVIGTTGTSNYFTWDIDRNQQRAWLSNELYVNGFTESEKALILLTSHETPGEGEDEFDDYLYIPSQEEVEEHMPDVQLRTAEMTDYVATKAKQETEEYIRWSLRSKATSSKSSMQIKEDGELGAMYTNVPNGVRPVMWLDIE